MSDEKPIDVALRRVWWRMERDQIRILSDFEFPNSQVGYRIVFPSCPDISFDGKIHTSIEDAISVIGDIGKIGARIPL